MKTANTLMVIVPYWYHKTWVFDDKAKGLEKEPFVMGIPEMIDDLVKGIPNAHNGFRLLLSATPFPTYQAQFIRLKEEWGGCWYRAEDTLKVGWLCHALFHYFDTPPKAIYFKAEQL